jgi:Tol biopolymer transport system component
VAANCTVSGGTQREVVAATGGTTRDTARVQFEVSCARTQKIAYGLWAAGISRINTAYADGSNPIQLGFGHSPSWVDERHLVYSTTYCYYYYGLPCTGGLVMVDTESGNDAGLLNGETGFDPAVSPAGDRIAFVRYDANQSGRLYLMAMGGFPANLVSLPGVLSASEPTWSPDGSRIAFACVILPGNADICLANADGTGVTRLSSDPGWDSDPAWSPDGGVLAFETTRFTGGGDIALLDISTRDVTRLTRGWDPAWSVTGMALIFASDDCVPPVGVPCPRGVFTINRDGTGRLRLTAGEHSSPSWRP